MDERLDYGSEEQLRKTSSDWKVGHVSSGMSLEKESSTLFLQYRNYHLHLVHKRDVQSERPRIPSLKVERLSFYRNYTASPTKFQIVCMQQVHFNRYLWTYCFNTFFKSIPHTYTHVFLASYTPEEHMFVAKMVPFFHGTKIVMICASFLEFLMFVNNSILMFGYLIQGLVFKNPWNRCEGLNSSTERIGSVDVKVNCYELKDFAKKVKNTTWTFTDEFRLLLNGEVFEMAQVEYFRKYISTTPYIQNFTYHLLIWITAVTCETQILKRQFWKILLLVQNTVIAVDLLSFIYLSFDYYNTDVIEHDISHVINNDTLNLWNADIDLLAESTTAPPVIHVLTARSTQEIEPSGDAAGIVMSNVFMYLFRGLLMYRLKNFCDKEAGAPIQYSEFNENAWFYIWPVFFSTFGLGDLFSISFLILNLANDMLTMTVTYHCLIEIIIWEWKSVTRWLANIMLGVSGVAAFLHMPYLGHVVNQVFFKSIVTFVEIFAIYSLYPVGRLVDDITFHLGAPPNSLRILALRLMPIYYFVKSYKMISNMVRVMHDTKHLSYEYEYFWIIPIALYALGMIYIIYKYIWIDKMGWQRMFIPDNDWGPFDYNARQLRKQYDSRFYLGPQAPRSLSRYMIGKSEARSFQLDLNYDPTRRSTIATSMFRFETEKKLH